MGCVLCSWNFLAVLMSVADCIFQKWSQQYFQFFMLLQQNAALWEWQASALSPELNKMWQRRLFETLRATSDGVSFQAWEPSHCWFKKKIQDHMEKLHGDVLANNHNYELKWKPASASRHANMPVIRKSHPQVLVMNQMMPRRTEMSYLLWALPAQHTSGCLLTS